MIVISRLIRVIMRQDETDMAHTADKYWQEV